MGSLGTYLHLHWIAIGEVVKISSRVPSTCAQNTIHCLQIIHIISSRQIYVAIDNPSLIPSVSCPTTSSYLRNYIRAAEDISDFKNLHSNGCRWVSHMYSFRDRIHVTQVFRYCHEHKGSPVLNEITILILELDFE
jgi:hypothetical protein